jgi:alcohol dehydrogenase class IV
MVNWPSPKGFRSTREDRVVRPAAGPPRRIRPPAAAARYARLGRLMGVDPTLDDEAAASAGTERLERWLADLGAPRRLPWAGCPPEDLDVIVGDVLGRAMAKDNPRDSSAEDLGAIVERCIAGW